MASTQASRRLLGEVDLYLWWGETGRALCLQDPLCPDCVVRAVDEHMKRWERESDASTRNQFLFIGMLKHLHESGAQ